MTCKVTYKANMIRAFFQLQRGKKKNGSQRYMQGKWLHLPVTFWLNWGFLAAERCFTK